MSDAPKKNAPKAAASDPTHLTTKEVAALLRVRERKVYDLAAAGEIPCRRVTGKLLFPKAEIEAWLRRGAPLGASSSPASASASTPAPAHAPGAASRPPLVIVGSHDPLLDWALRRSGCAIPALFSGSLDGLTRIGRGEAAAAAMHLYNPAGGDWNIAALEASQLPDRFALIAFARRRQGLLFPKDAPAPSGLADLPGRRLMLRPAAAGGRLLLEALLEAEGLTLKDLALAQEEAPSENDLAEAVAEGRAEVALGLEAAAQAQGLGFLPLIEERFDLLVARRAYFDPPLQDLFRFFRSEAFAKRAAALPGYDVSCCGEARWNGPA